MMNQGLWNYELLKSKIGNGSVATSPAQHVSGILSQPIRKKYDPSVLDLKHIARLSTKDINGLIRSLKQLKKEKRLVGCHVNLMLKRNEVHYQQDQIQVGLEKEGDSKVG
jgi:hypothetical protein